MHRCLISVLLAAGVFAADSLIQVDQRRLVSRADLAYDTPASRPEEGMPLAGLTFVITGTLAGMQREAAEDALRALGAKVSGSVSKKTSFLVVGADAGSKLAKAQSLGVRILEEAALEQILKTRKPPDA